MAVKKFVHEPCNGAGCWACNGYGIYWADVPDDFKGGRESKRLNRGLCTTASIEYEKE